MTNKAAVALGQRGGRATARKLTAEQRALVASNAAAHRWAGLYDHLQARWQELKQQPVGMVGLQVIKAQPPLLKKPGQLYAFKEGDELLTLEELADRLKISKTTAYGLTRKRAKIRSQHPLPCIKLGKELRFVWSQVVAWLSQLEEASHAGVNLVRQTAK